MIPRTLAENAGLDPIDVIVDLRNRHEAGDKWAGVDINTGKAKDLFKDGVIEPLQIKTQAIQSSAEAAEMILRIDDVISASGFSKRKGGAPDMGAGMPPGMGGMGGMM